MSVALVNGHVLLPDQPDWSERIVTTRTWDIGVAPAVTGAEDRVATRTQPLRSAQWTVTPDSLPAMSGVRDRMHAALESALLCAPAWGRGSTLSIACNSGATSATVDSPAWTWAVGQWLFLSETEQRLLTGVAGSVLSWTTPIAADYAAGEWVWPLLFGRPIVDDLSWRHSRQSPVRVTLRQITA